MRFIKCQIKILLTVNNMQWNIGFDAKRLFNNFTGLGNYSRNLLDGLPVQNPDFNFHLYTPFIKQEDLLNSFHSKSFNIHLPSTSLKAFWRSFGITTDLIKDQIHLYHGLSNEIPFNFPKNKIKSVVTIHDLIFKIYPNTYPLLDRLIYNLKCKYACKQTDLILACSESSKKDICNYYETSPDKIKVLYQSCHPEFKIEKEATYKKSILKKYKIPSQFYLYVGSIEQRKNLLLLIDAYALLPNELKIPLVIVGKNAAFKHELLKKAEKLQLLNQIVYIHDLKSVQDLSAVYQSAEIFIYPSRYEGFGIPILEAAFSKTAIITSNSSSLPEAGGPFCNYFNPDSSEELCFQIEKILTDEAFKKSSIEKTYKHAELHFNNATIQNQMIQYYKNLLEI